MSAPSIRKKNLGEAPNFIFRTSRRRGERSEREIAKRSRSSAHRADKFRLFFFVKIFFFNFFLKNFFAKVIVGFRLQLCFGRENPGRVRRACEPSPNPDFPGQKAKLQLESDNSLLRKNFLKKNKKKKFFRKKIAGICLFAAGIVHFLKNRSFHFLSDPVAISGSRRSEPRFLVGFSG